MAAEQQAKLCPLGFGHMKLMDRKDLRFANVQTPLGLVMVGCAGTPEGVEALQAHAATAQKLAAMMARDHQATFGTMKRGMSSRRAAAGAGAPRRAADSGGAPQGAPPVSLT